MNPDKQPKTILLYGCQICAKKFRIEVLGPGTPKAELVREHVGCEGFFHAEDTELKGFRGFGILVGIREENK
jgi:hypothetical protein